MDDLQNYQYTMDSCNHCGQCKWILPSQMHGWDFSEICPIHAHFGFDAYSGQGLINIAKEVKNGTLSYSSGLVDLINTCTLCGACDVNCKSVRDMEVLDTILALKEDCAKKGHVPEACRVIADNILHTKNIYGKDPAGRFSWLPEGFKDHPDSDTALFIGCAAAYEHPEIARSSVLVLQTLDVPFRLLFETEECCGIRLWQSGRTDDFETIVRRQCDNWKKLGIRRIITACAECYGVFRGGYPRITELPVEIVHISQIAEEEIGRQDLSLHPVGIRGTVTWHDPCLLGRRSERFVPWNGEIQAYGLHVPPKIWRRGENGCYDEPRNLIRRIPDLTFSEMPRHAEEAWCCGGSIRETDPALSGRIAEERRREAASVHADTVITACPFCEDSLGRDAPEPFSCVDLTVLLARALCGEEGA